LNILTTDQDAYRQRLYKYINERGTKYIFVAAKIGVPPYVLSQFRHGRNIWDESLDKLDQFLRSENY